MRIGNDRRRDDFEINVIPLIDVLLTLLMFFVLTTTFVRHSRMQVTLPHASDATTKNAQAHPLLIVIDREGRFYIGNRRVLGGDETALKRAVSNAAGGHHDQPVTLRADAKTPHQAVVTAMDVLGQLGFSHLSIATTPEQGRGSG